MENSELETLSHERAEFAAAVAHVFKTPLATMMAFTEVLKTQREGELNKAQLAHLATIQRGGRVCSRSWMICWQ
jgi:signal transduction histidine kinase